MYVVKKSFMDGKGKDGKPKIFKIGESYAGERAEEFYKRGNLVKSSELDLQDMEAVSKKLEEKKAELSALEAQLKKLREKLPAKEAASGAPAASGKEKNKDK